jgi:hypothetical protein
LTFKSGEVSNPNGRPKGSRNKRTEEIFTRLEARGDLDPADLLSSIVTNTTEPKELRIQAAGLLLPYRYGKCGSLVPLRYNEQPVQVPRATSIQQATDNIAYLSELKAQGQLDLDFADSLITDNKAILAALVEEAKLLAAQGGPREQTIRIEGGLPELPGTNVIMPHEMNGHVIRAIESTALGASPSVSASEVPGSQSPDSADAHAELPRNPNGGTP